MTRLGRTVRRLGRVDVRDVRVETTRTNRDTTRTTRETTRTSPAGSDGCPRRPHPTSPTGRFSGARARPRPRKPNARTHSCARAWARARLLTRTTMCGPTEDGIIALGGARFRKPLFGGKMARLRQSNPLPADHRRGPASDLTGRRRRRQLLGAAHRRRRPRRRRRRRIRGLSPPC